MTRQCRGQRHKSWNMLSPVYPLFGVFTVYESRLWSGICASLIAYAMPERSASCALLHFTHCWKDGWCRLKELLFCLVNSVLPCFFHTPLEASLWNMAQKYNTVSFIVATSTMQYSSLWIAWKILYVTCSTYWVHCRISEFSVKCYPCVAPVAPQQLYKGLKCKTKHC